MPVKRNVPKTRVEAEAMDQGRGQGVAKGQVGEWIDLGDGIVGSDQQEMIWREMLTGTKNMIVRAFAGTGKTTTKIRGLKLMEAHKLLPKYVNVAAFGRAIGKELQAKVPTGVRAGTLHGFGLSACSYVNREVEIEQDKMDLLLTDIMGERLSKDDREIYFHVLKLVSLCKNTLAGEVWEEDGSWFFTVVPEVLDQLCDRFSINVDEFRTKTYRLVEELMVDGLNQNDVIDQDDMIWWPVVKNYRVFRANLLVVDEAQDLNACQQALVMKAGDRILLVGDQFQAIYGFRGADVYSLQTMVDLLQATRRGLIEYPLTKTRRCPQSHVAYVKKRLKGIKGMEALQKFEALPEAPVGLIDSVDADYLEDTVKAGDMVVCRTNAPIVSLAFACIRKRKRVRIQGRDLGASLAKLIKAHARGSDDTKVLKENFEVWAAEQVNKLRRTKGQAKRERMLSQFYDTAASLRYFIANSSTVSAILQTLNDLFRESPGGVRDFILLGTAHALKGMEAETVWVYGPEEMPHRMATTPEDIEQEWNLWYVAHTRSKMNMFLVTLPKNEEQGVVDG